MASRAPKKLPLEADKDAVAAQSRQPGRQSSPSVLPNTASRHRSGIRRRMRSRPFR